MPDAPPHAPSPSCPDSTIIGEAQLVLAEKRTTLAVLRTGIAVFVLPLSVLGLLVATSRYYSVGEVLHFLLPLLTLCLALATLGGYLCVRALLRLRREDHIMRALKARHANLAPFLD
jgi:uncharacterized membrane protein YidH (DUF202 family)